jgi:hypothetical protein
MRFFGIEVVLGCVLWFIPLAYFAGPVTSASRHFCPQSLLPQIIQWGWVPPQFGNWRSVLSTSSRARSLAR